VAKKDLLPVSYAIKRRRVDKLILTLEHEIAVYAMTYAAARGYTFIQDASCPEEVLVSKLAYLYGNWKGKK
jgi:hypothetical protein